MSEPLAPKPAASKHIGDHAIVIGASISGLLAARVLGDYFDRVTVLERDQLPDQAEIRSGVPQAHHLHVLLRRGQISLNRFFPKFEESLDDAGVPAMRWMQDTCVLGQKGWLPQTDLGFATRNCSRSLLEWLIRGRLTAYSNVCFQDNCQIDRLISDVSRSRITGVEVTYRHGAGESAGQTDTLHADFVVDASGRTSRTPEWLEALGYSKPDETLVDSFLGYSSRVYASLRSLVDWKGCNIVARPPEMRRNGVISLLEGGRWMVTLSGYNRDYPPTDEAAFLEFARSLPSPLVYDVINNGEPLTPIYGYRRTANRLRHYEYMAHWPEGFAVMGDAACCFNPVYGQGMTISALGAETLDSCLRVGSDLIDIGQRFQKQLAKTNAMPWLLATGADFQFPKTEGRRPPKSSQLAQHYLNHLQQIMVEDTEAAKSFVEVMNLLKPPVSLFRPRLFVPTVKNMLSGRKPAAL